MAITTGIFDETQRTTLARLCDAFVPSIERDPDPDGFWARSASDLGVPAQVEDALAAIPPEVREQIREFMDGLAALGFPDASLEDRERFIHAFMDATPEALAGIMTFKSLTLLFFCGRSPVNNAHRAADRSRRYIPNVEIEVVADAGHMLPVERPALFTERVLRFVDAIDPTVSDGSAGSWP